MSRFEAFRTERFTESVIRETTRLAVAHDAVNLAQGFPDFPAPEALKQAARDAIAADHNQYTITWGARNFREALAARYGSVYGFDLDAEREITACCGSTEGMIASLLATTNPGDEVVVFEPYYENYAPDSLLCGAERRFVKLRPPHWTFDSDELRAAFSPRTKAIILNTPHNPTGRVFTRGELLQIAELCQEFDALCITDEIYEHIVYDGAEHISAITLPGMRDRTIVVNSMSKTYSVTGWRVGWIIASAALTDSIRKVHDFLTVHAPAPLQQAGIAALALPPSYYEQLARDYTARRDRMFGLLGAAGFDCIKPKGAYYIMAGVGRFGFQSDTDFVRHLIEKVGVAAVPGSSFFNNPADGAAMVRFCFCKKVETIDAAAERLAQLRS